MWSAQAICMKGVTEILAKSRINNGVSPLTMYVNKIMTMTAPF